MPLEGINLRILDLCRRLDNDFLLPQELREKYLEEIKELVKKRETYEETRQTPTTDKPAPSR